MYTDTTRPNHLVQEVVDNSVDEAIAGYCREIEVTLRKFEVRSVTLGEDAQGEAVVTVECNGRSYRGSSVTTDIVESGVRAFLAKRPPRFA